MSNYERCPKCGNNETSLISKKKGLFSTTIRGKGTQIIQCQNCGEIGCITVNLSGSKDRLFLPDSNQVKVDQNVCFICKCESSKRSKKWKTLGYVTPSKSEMERQNPGWKW